MYTNIHYLNLQTSSLFLNKNPTSSKITNFGYTLNISFTNISDCMTKDNCIILQSFLYNIQK